MIGLISVKNLTILQNDWFTAKDIAQYHMVSYTRSEIFVKYIFIKRTLFNLMFFFFF